MLKFSIGVLLGCMLMHNLQSIKTEGFEPWKDNQVHRTHRVMHIIVHSLPHKNHT